MTSSQYQQHMHCNVISGVGLHRAGEGPVLLLLPGLAGLAKFWDSTAQLLIDRFQVIAIDHPGMGSSLPIEEHSIQGIAEGVIRVLDELEIQRCAVLGHSTGGLVAQALALDHPSRLTGLILSSTWASPDNRFRDLFQLRKFVLNHAGHSAYVRLGQILAYPPEWYEQHHSQEPTASLGADPPSEARTISQRIDMLLSYQRANELPNVKLRTLVVGALDDNIVPFYHSQDLARRIPGAQLAELSGGHFAPTTRTADYTRLIANFLGDPL
ncbi:alpha/beta fold hydrolase [Variovorax boronicumulans]